MVKLGSLYRNNDINGRQPQRNEAVTLDRLEFNQRMQERRLLQEEQKQWDRLSPNHSELQVSVWQLYRIPNTDFEIKFSNYSLKQTNFSISLSLS